MLNYITYSVHSNLLIFWLSGHINISDLGLAELMIGMLLIKCFRFHYFYCTTGFEFHLGK